MILLFKVQCEAAAKDELIFLVFVFFVTWKAAERVGP